MNTKTRKTTDPRIVVGYVRASTDRQELGPVAQRETLEKWCAAHGAELVAVFEDLGVSGGSAIEKRPGLLDALAALPEHKAGTLLAAKRDRVARDPLVALMVEREAGKVGARVVSAAGEGTDDDDPASILMRRIFDAFGEFERGLIRARTRAALRVKARRGQKTGGAVPFGYRLAPDGTTLERDDAEQGVVDLIRALRADGLSFAGIAERLAEAGHPCRGSRWHGRTVGRIVGREAPAA